MKKQRTTILIALVSILVVLSSIGFSMGWLPGVESLIPTVHSSVLRNYFESGDGKTADTAFVIHTPRHLYNLAWLQNMGMFNRTDESGNIVQYYFKMCDGGSDCKIDTAEVTTLDMDGWVLPPIGTAQYPFVGNFDGNGRIIKNLKVSGQYSDLKDSNPAQKEAVFAQGALDPDTNYGIDIVGVFGVIGSLEDEKTETRNTNAKTKKGVETKGTYSASVNEVKNISLDNVTVVSNKKKTPDSTSEKTTTLNGIAAGYVNGTLKNIRVSNSSLDSTGSTCITSLSGKSSENDSVTNYSTIGFCRDEYKGLLTNTDIVIGEPTVSASVDKSSQYSGNAWGSSVDLFRMFKRVQTVSFQNFLSDQVYLIENGTKGADGKVSGGTEHEEQFRRYEDENDGVYTLSRGSAVLWDGFSYAYLSGGAHVTNCTIIEPVNQKAYIITDNHDNCLSLDVNTLSATNKGIVNTTDRAAATRWVFDSKSSGYEIYTVYRQVKYYLCKSNDNTLEAKAYSTSINPTIWTKTDTSTTAYESYSKIKTSAFNIGYNGAQWVLSSFKTICCSSDTSKKLGIKDGKIDTSVETVWGFDVVNVANNITYYTISGIETSTTDGSTKKWYLSRVSGTSGFEKVTLTETPSTLSYWYLNGNSIQFDDGNTDLESSACALVYSKFDNEWKYEPTKYRAIVDIDKNYLGADKSNISSSIDVATKTSSTINTPWYEGNKAASDTNKYTCSFYTVLKIDGVYKKFYLNSNSGSLKIQNSDASTGHTIWTVDTSNGCILDPNNRALICVNQVWKSLFTYSITDSENNALGVKGSGNSAAVSNDTGTKWLISSATGETSICTRVGSNDYRYIYKSGQDVKLKTAVDSKWTIANNQVRYNDGTSTSPSYKFLFYNSSWQLGDDVGSKKIIRSNVDQNDKPRFLTDSSSSERAKDHDTTNRYNAGLFTFSKIPDDSNAVNTTIKGNTYYLGLTGGAIKDLGFQSSAYSWEAYYENSLYYIRYKYSRNTHHYIMYYHPALDSLKGWYTGNSSTYSAYIGVRLEDRYLKFKYDTSYSSQSNLQTTSNVQDVSGTTKLVSKEDDLRLYVDILKIEGTSSRVVSDYWDYYRDNVTYFPISAKYTDNTTAGITITTKAEKIPGNTGYLISGSRNQYSGGVGENGWSPAGDFPAYSGDIRLGRSSKTNTIASKYLSNNTINSVLTIGKEGLGELGTPLYPKRMFPKFYGDGTDANPGVKGSYETLLSGSTVYLYGMHFMEAEVNKDSVVHADGALIDHVSYDNYEMPASSIDCNFQARGSINFLAGTYFNGEVNNNCFFSLHQVFRKKESLDNEKSIMAIFENAQSKKIYKCIDGKFYEYSDGILKETILSSNFDTEYSQKNTNVYMHLTDSSQPLIYKYEDGNYYTCSISGAETRCVLPETYSDANSINSIKEIQEIYAVYSDDFTVDGKYDYIYRYGDEDYSVPYSELKDVGSTSFTYQNHNYKLAFNTAWMKEPEKHVGLGKKFSDYNTDALFYFEVPVSRGEYLLASVTSSDEVARQGAYLLYLDIAASAQSTRAQEITEVKNTKVATYEYPRGVQLVENPVSGNATTQEYQIDEIDSAGIRLINGGTNAISRDENEISCNNTNAKASFIGGGIKVILGDGGVAVDSESITAYKLTEIYEETVIHTMLSGSTSTKPEIRDKTVTKQITLNGSRQDPTMTYAEGSSDPESVTYDGHTLTPMTTNKLITLHSIKLLEDYPIKTTPDDPPISSSVTYDFSVDGDGLVESANKAFVAKVALTNSGTEEIIEDQRYPYFRNISNVEGNTFDKEEELTLTVTY